MNYIKGFDTLRAISITMVVVSHLLPSTQLQEMPIWKLMSGDTGVLIFFVISGFLITSILLKEKGKKGYINLKNFFARRFIRLLPPLIILYSVIAVLMSLDLIQNTFIGLFVSMFYLYNFVPNRFYTAELGHTWSLGLEEQFYLTWPFIIGKLNIRNTLVFIGIILICCILFFYLIYPNEFLRAFKAHRWFIPAIAPILIGSAGAILFHQKQHTTLEASAGINGLFFFMLFYTSPIFLPSNLLIISPIIQSFGIIFLLLWIVQNQSTDLVRALEFKPIRYIGRISYGIYVYQGLFLRTGPGSELWFQQFPQNIVLTLIVALLSYELMEKSILKLKKKYV